MILASSANPVIYKILARWVVNKTEIRVLTSFIRDEDYQKVRCSNWLRHVVSCPSPVFDPLLNKIRT